MSLNYTIARLAEMGPESREFVTLDGDRFCEAAHEAAAQRIEACVNACASIPTESLTALNWQLAPVGGAKPVDVAALLLRLGTYRKVMEKLVEQAQRCNFEDENGCFLSMNTVYYAIEEVLK